MKQKIESALSVLIGLPLWGGHRAADLQVLKFGIRISTADRKGRPCEIGEYGLHLQCPWRISGPDGVVVGAMDLYHPPGEQPEVPPDFNWETGNRRDERLSAFFERTKDNPTQVLKASANDCGGFVLDLAGGFQLEVFPADSLPDEYWRLLKPRDLESHFVVTGKGIEQ